MLKPNFYNTIFISIFQIWIFFKNGKKIKDDQRTLIYIYSFVLFYHKAATGFLLLSSLAYQNHTKKQLTLIANICITYWFELFCKSNPYHIVNISSILPRKYAVLISCSYQTLDTYIFKKNSSLIKAFININNTALENLVRTRKDT